MAEPGSTDALNRLLAEARNGSASACVEAARWLLEEEEETDTRPMADPVALLEQAAAADHLDALCLLGDLRAGHRPFTRDQVGTDTPPDRVTDLEAALDCYRRAEALGDNRARFALSILLLNEIGRRQDVAEVMLKTCAADGLPRAYQTLGEMYRHGIGVPADPERARSALHAAAIAGEAAACHMLGVMLWNGEGGGQVPVEGYCWILEAAALGNGAESEALVEVLAPQLTEIEHAMAINLIEDWAEDPAALARPLGRATSKTGKTDPAWAEAERSGSDWLIPSSDEVALLEAWRGSGDPLNG